MITEKQEDEITFHKLINVLAKMCNFELDEEVLEVYDDNLSHHGYENLGVVLSDIIATRETNDQFPSIAEINRRINPEVCPKRVADDIANRILGSIRRHDYPWPQGTHHTCGRRWEALHTDGTTYWCSSFLEALNVEVGEIGVLAIDRMGGYNRVVEEWRAGNNMTALRAQLRDLVLSIIDQAKAGKLHSVAMLPEADNKNLNKVKALAAKSVKSITGSTK